MAIKIFIKRHFKEGRTEETLTLLKQFRHKAMDQPGYVSGETLINHYDARSITVISTWESIDDWIRWQESAQRESTEANLERFLEQPTKYEVYDIGRPSAL
jgi:heme-degrading monooxygenase HmoA